MKASLISPPLEAPGRTPGPRPLARSPTPGAAGVARGRGERALATLLQRALRPAQARSAVDTGYDVLIDAARSSARREPPASRDPRRGTGSAAPAIAPSADRTIQRACACGGQAGPGACAACAEARGPSAERAAEPARPTGSVPPIVHDVLRSPGQALDADTRSFMEPRLGRDLGHVRVHTGAEAARSAQAVDALAYTVGNDIVFGEGRYAPGSSAGRGILAHELAHTIQQGAGRPALDRLTVGAPDTASEREADEVRAAIEAGSDAVEIREDAAPAVARLPNSPAGGCGVCYGTPANAGIAAHNIIEAAFVAMNPTVQVEVPLLPSPADDNGRLDLAVLTGPGSIAIGEIKPANPAGLLRGDMDLRWYETQLEQLGMKVSRLILPPPLQGLPFPTLAAPPCIPEQLLYVDPPALGIYTYWCTPDYAQLVGRCRCDNRPPPPPPVPEKKTVDEKQKEKVEEKDKQRRGRPIEGPVPQPVPVPVRDVATLLAALAALAALSSKLKGVAKGRALAYATAIAAVLLIVSGKAEASIGLEGDDALEALLKLAEARGQTIPDDIKQAMRDDPKLRDALRKAAKTGNFSEVQREAGERLARLLAAHSDELTQEELEILLEASEGASGSMPGPDTTIEDLKRAIEAKKRGAQGGGRPGGPDTEGPGEPGPRDAEPGTLLPAKPPRTPEERLVEGMTTGAHGGPKLTDALRDRLLAAARTASPPLTDREVDELLNRLASAAGKSEDEIVESVRRGVAALRAAKAAEGGTAPPPGPEPADNQAAESPGKLSTDQAVLKAKQGAKDPKSEAILESKLGWIEAGATYVFGAEDLVFTDGKPFAASIAGRDRGRSLFFGKGPVTPRQINGAWYLEVPAGIKLTGAAGHYGTTRKLRMPALPGVGARRKQKAPAE